MRSTSPAEGRPASPANELPETSASERYSRQILFPGIGETGQRRLAQAHAAIIGVGATGATTASLLARAGVGRLTLIDRDFVEPSNLQRQALFDEKDARRSEPKATAARNRLLLYNSSISVTAHVTDLIPDNIESLLGGADLLLDGTDNFETRYLLNDFAVATGRPWIYAAAIGAYAASMTILPRLPPTAADPSRYAPTACLACLFPDPPSGTVETCDTAGILASAVTLAASLQSTEALKVLTGQWHQVRRTLASVDLWEPAKGRLSQAEARTDTPRADCTVCGARNFRHLAGSGRPHLSLCGRNSVQIHERHRPIDLPALQSVLEGTAECTDIRSNSLLLRFRRGPLTVTLFPDGRAVIGGTTDLSVARSVYARFVGS